MTITHHPEEELLVAYASGASGEATALLVATHLALCPQCRRAVAAMEKTGGAMLSALEPVALTDRALERTMARLGEPEKPAPARQRLDGDLTYPEPLRSYLGDRGGGWVQIGPGITYRPLMKRGRVRARLLRGLPGSAVPMHTHEGSELTLILTGALTDDTGRYVRGDVQTTSPDVTHQPTVEAGEACINLAVTDAPLVFRTPIPRIVGKVFGF